MYLIVDTETTGLPRDPNGSISDYDNWPRIVQIAWMLCDDEGIDLEFESYIIKPEGFSIPSRASSIHGISTYMAETQGYAIEYVFEKFNSVLTKAKYIVGHNVKFDIKVIASEMHRLGQSKPFKKHQLVCTKELSTEYCRIPGPYGYKWPSLSQLFTKLFGDDLHEAHRADIDVRACAECFFELKHRGVIAV